MAELIDDILFEFSEVDRLLLRWVNHLLTWFHSYLDLLPFLI